MNNLSSKIFEAEKKLRDSEKEIVKLLLEDPKENSQLSLDELSKKLFVSKSAIFRLCKKLGLSGYSELKFELMRVSEQKEIDSNASLIERTSEIVNGTIKQFCNMNLEKFFDALDKAGTIYLYSTGWQQQSIAEYISREMFVVGKNSIVLPNAFDEIRRCGTWAKKDDILFIVTYSGNRQRLYDELKKIQLVNNKIKIVSFSRPGANKISSVADFSLFFDTINFSNFEGFQNEKISFSPAYIFADLLINEFYLWQTRKGKSNEHESEN